ncbi:hypothetical protein IPL85_03640 [Candidatus Saccharibacteria bacterium]|nr:MAG: hypothetical protein IPL85_03640 [Candidatus Saccharibacteria bacterium]
MRQNEDNNVDTNGPFSVLKRIFSGEPAFQTDKKETQGSPSGGHGASPAANGANPYLQSSGRKVYPVAKVSSAHFHRSGDHSELRVHIHNDSPFEIQLDKIRIFGQTVELDNNLPSHGSAEFLLYRGHSFRARPETRAELVYQIIGSNDYFMNPHEVMFRQESDGVYLVTELRSRDNLVSDV